MDQTESGPTCQVSDSLMFSQLRNTVKLRFIKATMEMLTQAFISSCLDYRNSLFSCLSKTSLDRLQMVQNAAANLSSKRSHVTPNPIQSICDHL